MQWLVWVIIAIGTILVATLIWLIIKTFSVEKDESNPDIMSEK